MPAMVTWDMIAEFGSRLAREFDPEKVILFGSYAHGSATENSDVDILVILPFEGKGFHKSLEILNRLDPRFPIDLIARRPDDTARSNRAPRPRYRRPPRSRPPRSRL